VALACVALRYVRLHTYVSMQKQSRSTGQVDPAALLRLPQVLALVPVCPSTWWSGVKSGRFPRPIKLGPRITCWRAQDIFSLIEGLEAVNTSARNR
jgi:predicted DNA-binding transcriptional regulator AlpA